MTGSTCGGLKINFLMKPKTNLIFAVVLFALGVTAAAAFWSDTRRVEHWLMLQGFSLACGSFWHTCFYRSCANITLREMCAAAIGYSLVIPLLISDVNSSLLFGSATLLLLVAIYLLGWIIERSNRLSVRASE